MSEEAIKNTIQDFNSREDAIVDAIKKGDQKYIHPQYAVYYTEHKKNTSNSISFMRGAIQDDVAYNYFESIQTLLEWKKSFINDLEKRSEFLQDDSNEYAMKIIGVEILVSFFFPSKRILLHVLHLREKNEPIINMYEHPLLQYDLITKTKFSRDQFTDGFPNFILESKIKYYKNEELSHPIFDEFYDIENVKPPYMFSDALMEEKFSIFSWNGEEILETID